MSNMKIFLEFVADARRMKEGMRQGEQSMKSFSARAKKEAAKIRNAFSSLQGKLAGMGLSIGTGALLWQSANLDKSLVQIGQTAGATSNQLKELRSDLFRLGKESGQDVDSLKEGFNVLVQSGLNMKESTEALRGINTAMAITGADAKTLASSLSVAAEAFQFDLSKSGKATELLEKMTVAGRLGNAELENLAALVPRVAINATSAGLSFDKTLAFLEALSRFQRQPEQLGTLATNALRVFTDVKYMAKAQKATGINFFDAQGARRDFDTVIDDMTIKFKKLKTDQQRSLFIGKAFGEMDTEARTGIELMLKNPETMKAFREFASKLLAVGGTFKRDMDAATANLVDQAGRLKATLGEAADGFAAPVKNVLADLIRWGMDSKKNGGLELSGKEMLGYGAAAVGGTALLARYGGMAIKGIMGRFGKTGLGIAEGKAIQAATGVTPVFVTNWPNGGGLTAVGGVENLKNLAVAGKWLSWSGAAAAAGYGAGTLINKGMGRLSGKASGGKYGGDGWLGNMLYDVLHKEQKPPEVNNVINLRVDQIGRVIAETTNPNTNTKINVARGKF